MRLPFTKIHRAFPEFDSLTEEECDRYILYVRATRPRLVRLAPLAATLLGGAAWPLLLWGARALGLMGPAGLPFDADTRLVLIIAGSILCAAFCGLLVRDLIIWWGVRAEVHRARCPKCRQSLLGLPIQEIGIDGDPAKRFIRCPECGRKFCLMDLGLTPRDLVPFEQRGTPEQLGRRRTAT